MVRGLRMGAPEQTTLSYRNTGILASRGVGGQRLCCVHLPTQHSHPLQLPPPHLTGHLMQEGSSERDPEGAEALGASPG